MEAHVLDAATALPTLGAGEFDAVLASNVLEHFPSDTTSTVVRDVAGLLAPGGRFIIVQPNFRFAYRAYFDDYTHRSIFTHVSLANLLRTHGFAIDVCKPRFLPYSMRETRLPIRPMVDEIVVVDNNSRYGTATEARATTSSTWCAAREPPGN